MLVQLNICDVAETSAVIPVYCMHLEAIYKCPDFQGVLNIWVNLYAKASFGTITKCMDYAGVLFSKP